MSTLPAASEDFTDVAVVWCPLMLHLQVPTRNRFSLWVFAVFGRLAALVSYLFLLLRAWKQEGMAPALALCKDSISDVYSDVPRRILGPHFARQQSLHKAFAHLHALGQASVEVDSFVASASTAYTAGVTEPSEDSIEPLEPVLRSLAFAQIDYLDMAGLDVVTIVARLQSITDDLKHLTSVVRTQLDAGSMDMARAYHTIFLHTLVEDLSDRIETFAENMRPAAYHAQMQELCICTLAVVRSPFTTGLAAVAGPEAPFALAPDAAGPAIEPLLQQLDALRQVAMPQYDPHRIARLMPLSLDLVEAEVAAHAVEEALANAILDVLYLRAENQRAIERWRRGQES
ncbi:hypothetical protein JCM10449v2_003309 [Rhodotorula kratochvilovae]